MNLNVFLFLFLLTKVNERNGPKTSIDIVHHSGGKRNCCGSEEEEKRIGGKWSSKGMDYFSLRIVYRLNIFLFYYLQKYRVINRTLKDPVDRSPQEEKIVNTLVNNSARFKRMFRLCPQDFLQLLQQIAPIIGNPEKQRFVRNPISPMIKLAAALRFLAGGIYLDIGWMFEIPETSIHYHIINTLKAIDKVVDNVHFPYDDAAQLRQIASKFAEISPILPNTVSLFRFFFL